LRLLDGKNILVTGSARGIGRMIVLKASEEGARVIATDIDDESGRRVIEEVKDSGGKGEYLHMDVTNEKEVKKAFDYVWDRYGGVDGLVNNAGISGINPFTHETPTDEWDKVILVNLKGVFLCSKYAINQMIKKGGGVIVNMSSIAGRIGSDVFSPAYHASKGGVYALTLHDAITYSSYNIRFIAIQPGLIDTKMVEKVAIAFGIKEIYKDALKEIIPQGRMGTTEDVADLVIFLLSDKASYINGTAIVIDGALTAGVKSPSFLMDIIRENLRNYYK